MNAAFRTGAPLTAVRDASPIRANGDRNEKSSMPSAAVAGLFLVTAANAQTKWDMPTAYPASNFHTENIAQFAADVDKATGGKLKITVHANASLFKAPEIKRAVQGDQAQIGEILLVNYENEDAFVRPRRRAVPRHQLRRCDEALQGFEEDASRTSSPSRVSSCSIRWRGRRRASTPAGRSTARPT